MCVSRVNDREEKMINQLDRRPVLGHRLDVANTKRKILVYVAGPFNADTKQGRDDNCKKASGVGAQVVNLGGFPVVPHNNTKDYYGMRGEDFFLDGCIELVLRCDAVIMVPGWKDSLGAQLEAQKAAEAGMPVFKTLEGLAAYLVEQGVKA